MKEVFEKSVVLLEDVPAAMTLTKKMLGVKKPGIGIPARRLKEFIGRKTARDLKANTLLREEDLVA